MPALKFSATTSKCGTSCRNSSRPRSALEVEADAALVEVVAQERRADRDGPAGRSIAGSDAAARTRRATGCSTFTTSAPRRASSWVPNGSACICSAASTRTPSSGLPYRWASAFATSPSFTVDLRASSPIRRSRCSVAYNPSRARHHQRRRIRAVPTARPVRDRGVLRQRRRARGPRSVAAYDEDTTTMGVEAARFALAQRGDGAEPDALWFATADPAYLDKTNATAIHAALRARSADAPAHRHRRRSPLRRRVAARGARRQRLRARRDGRHAQRPADQRRRGRRRRRRRRGARRRRRRGRARDRRAPRRRRRPPRSSSTGGAHRATSTSKQWEERFGEIKYAAARRAGLERRAQGRRSSRPSRSTASSSPARTRARTGRSRAGSAPRRRPRSTTSPRPSATPATAQAGCCSPPRSRRPSPVRSSRWSSLADGADVLVFRTTDAIASYTPARPVATQVDNGAPIPYGKFLSLAGRRHASSRRAGPSPIASRPRSPVARRSGSTRSSGRVTSRAARCTCRRTCVPRRRRHRRHGCGADEPTCPGTIATFTIDRIAYSPSPPIVFAVVDFDGGGRLPVELTDVEADDAHDRRPGRDDVPQAVHRRRHPQLLLEGPPDPRAVGPREEDRSWHRTASRTRSRSSAWAARRFGEHWDKGADDLLVDASEEAFASAGVNKDDVDAYWLGTAHVRHERAWRWPRPLQLQNKPVTRVENFCATGSEALRQRRLRGGERRVRHRRWRSASRR